MAEDKIYLGIDVGGTFIKLGIVNESGEILCRGSAPVDRSGEEPVMATIVGAASSLCGEAGVDYEELEGIGICAPGSVDVVKGEIAQNGGNVPGWSGTAVCAELTRQTGLPATLVNDGNAVALGEAWTGAAKGCSDVVCVVIGTGVGGGIISGGGLVEGVRGFGGEIGHFPTHAGDGELCACGRRGCYERYASTSALVRRALKKDPAWLNGRVVIEAAAGGNADALHIIDEWLDEAAYGICGLVHIFDPEMVIVGGGVSAQKELVTEPLARKVKELIMPDFREGLVIKGAELGNDAGLTGAVRNFMLKHICVF